MRITLFYFVLCLLTSLYFYYYHNVFFIILALFFLYRALTYNKKNIIIILLVTLFIIYFEKSITIPQLTSNQYTIIKVNKYNYWANNKEGTILLKTDLKLGKGSKVQLSKQPIKINSLQNFNLFDYQTYLMTNNIYYEVFDNKLKIIKLKKEASTKDKITTYQDYLFFMDKKDFDETIYQLIIDLAIIHIVVISGYHFNLLNKVLDNLFFFIPLKYRKIVINLLLFMYLLKLSFSYPALRAFLLICLKSLFNKFNLSYLEQIALIALLILLFKPISFLSFSFIFTFYLSFMIGLLPKEIKESKLLFSWYLYLASLPLVSFLNYEISLLAFFYGIIFLPIIIILYTLLILNTVIPIMQLITITYIDVFEKLLHLANSINYKINTGSLPFLIISLYLIIYFLSIHLIKKNKLMKLSPLLLLIIYSFLPSINGTITFLNVGQGDCIIIKPPFSNQVMMIDVAKPYKQNTVNSIVIPYLKSNKIKEVSKLVITHDDLDHAGGKDDLINNFNVKEVIAKKQQKITFNKYTFYDFLYDEQFKDDNSNSITLYSRINNLNYFFTGDMTSESENMLLTKLEKMPIDVLKVAHHGSKTSSTLDFLLFTNPRLGIYMSKLNNRYNHPHPIIKKRFKDLNIQTYNTANNATIIIYFNYFFNYVKTYK